MEHGRIPLALARRDTPRHAETRRDTQQTPLFKIWGPLIKEMRATLALSNGSGGTRHREIVQTAANVRRLTLGPRQHTSARAWHHSVRSAVDHTPVVLQTPWVCLSCTPQRIVRPSFAAHLLLCEFWRENEDRAQCEWLRFLKHLRRTMHAWVKRCDGCASWGWHGALQRADGRMSWQLSCRNLELLRTFDATRHPSTSAALRAGSYVRFIVQLEHVWFNRSSALAGTHFRILQAQHCALEPPSDCAFATVARRLPPADSKSTEDDISAHATHEIFGKYFRMLAVGIPRPCVEQKMHMQSLDPSILDTPPDAPLPLPDGGNGGNGGNGGLFKELTAMRALRKVTNHDAAEPKVGAASRSTNGHGISLKQIRERLRSLRRVAQNGWRKKDKKDTDGEQKDAPLAKSATPRRQTDSHALFTLLDNKYASDSER